MIATLALLIFAPTITSDIVYNEAGGEQVKLDLYQPEKTEKAMPAIVMIHGGSWISGDKRDMGTLAKTMCDQGFVVANINYRLAPKHKWPAMLDDVQTAVRYVRSRAKELNVDPNRIGSAGASAGGHLALLLGCRETRDTKPEKYPGLSSKVQAVLDLFGPVDLTNMTDYPPAMDALAVMIMGKKRADAPEVAKDFSPYFHLDKSTAPVFIYQGLKDPLVPPAQSRTLEAKLKELGVDVQSVYLEGVGHEVPQGNPKALEAVASGIAFMKKHLDAK